MPNGYQSSISSAYINKYSDTVFELAQQTMSRLRPFVNFVQVDAQQLILPRIGNIEAQPLNVRFPEVQPADAAWDSRALAPLRYGVATFLDTWDEEKMLADPKSELAKRQVQALERYLDRIIIQALNATVMTGPAGNVPLTAAQDGVNVINAQQGFTYDTLLTLEQFYESVEIGTESQLRKALLISEEEHAQLMKEGTLISGDFTDQRVVDKGRMTRALDFDVILYGSGTPNPLLPVQAGVRNCFVLTEGAITVGMTRDTTVEVEKRPDRWNTWQVLCSYVLGAVRMEGPRVQVIQTTV